jgi:hypothetical protein
MVTARSSRSCILVLQGTRPQAASNAGTKRVKRESSGPGAIAIGRWRREAHGKVKNGYEANKHEQDQGAAEVAAGADAAEVAAADAAEVAKLGEERIGQGVGKRVEWPAE